MRIRKPLDADSTNCPRGLLDWDGANSFYGADCTILFAQSPHTLSAVGVMNFIDTHDK